MKFQVDHDYHIHSRISLCSNDPEQNNERILQYAKENGFSRICLTDHHWQKNIPGVWGDFYWEQDLEHIQQALPLPQADGVEFLFGCETDMNCQMIVGVSKEEWDLFDFIIVPTTHFHMEGFSLSKEDAKTTEGRARAWVNKLEALLEQDLPFHKLGVAHLACSLIDGSSREAYLSVLDAIPAEEMERLFLKAAQRGCGIELNSSDMAFSDEEADRVLRMFRIAKQCGCKFYLGSDAHHPKELDKAKAIFERAVDLLELTEEDKFHIGK